MEEDFCYIFNIQSPYFMPLTLVLYPDIGVALIKNTSYNNDSNNS